MITLPRGRTFRLVTVSVLVLITFLFLHSSLTDSETEYSRSHGSRISEKANLNRLLHQPGSPYTRGDLGYAQKAGLTLVPVDSVSANNTKDPAPTPRVKAAIVMLARNGDANGAVKAITSLQQRFNDRYHYPYVFLNDKPFDDNFKAKMRDAAPHSELLFGLIPREHWSYPDWIDQEKAKVARKEMREKNVIYGDSEPYRHMCRYNSGFFYRHPLLDEFEYYWRVEPDVQFHCDIPNDPFRFMQENNKLYGFTISLYEYIETIPTLWKTTREFIKEHPTLVRSDNAMRWLSDSPEQYNRCHFWSNFEIASLNLWRSKAYTEYFNYLDKAGGFFYERWGDAPVHSIGAAMILKPEQIHFFNNIGYYHGPFHHCPVDQPALADLCQCDGADNFDMNGYSCTSKWFKLFGGGQANIEAEKVRLINQEKKSEAKKKEEAQKAKEKEEEEKAKKKKEEEEKAAKAKAEAEKAQKAKDAAEKAQKEKEVAERAKEDAEGAAANEKVPAAAAEEKVPVGVKEKEPAAEKEEPAAVKDKEPIAPAA
ncbi:nucleotide-diphospho-sugar transferase [Powellomyces hirtus]|nr:nucleotide-diphospho-sugar transferase [Powellomyces hirtus]